MQLDGQAQAACGLEDLLGLGQREGDALAEHIDRIDQALGRQRGQHGAGDEVDVVLAAPCVLGRQRMRAQEGGAHGHAQGLAQAPGHAQLLALVLQRQAVARLDLDGADALVQQLLQARQGLGEQLVLAGLARGTHAGDDAAAGACHLLVAGAVQAHGSLARSPP